MTPKEAFDTLFSKVTFDTAFYKKLVRNNVEYITEKSRVSLFGSKLIGCFFIKYTLYDKNIFYNNLFNLEYEDVSGTVDSITTIPSNFKIARDDINLITFYIAHRFLTNESLSESKRLEYAKEVLNYFNYRTLVLISSNYFVYPISEEKALSLTERMSNRYVIKKLKNWNEYCQYRSDEFLKTKFLDVLVKFNKDDEIPNAINDLYNRTKDTLKNIYSEFIDMLEKDEVIRSKKSVVKDMEGNEVITDRLNTPESYMTKIEGLMSDRNSFVRKDRVEVTCGIVEAVSHKALEEFLTDLLEHSYKSKENNDKVKELFKGIMVNALDYLRQNSVNTGKGTNILAAISSIVGNILYARGTDVIINDLKSDIDDTLKKIYRSNSKYISDRNLKNMRNAVYVYVVLTALV
jgi:hypothetical protein